MTADSVPTSQNVPLEAAAGARWRHEPRSNVRVRFAHQLYRLATRLHWAEPELVGLSALIRPGDEVIDVGAALGMYTVPLADLVGPNGRVTSFEPQPRGIFTVRLLRLLTGPHRGRVSRVAVGDREDPHSTIVVPFHKVFPIFGHGHVAGRADDRVGRKYRTRAPMTTIDAWSAAQGLGRIAFIKVDVEGFEPSVIAGAAEVIGRDLPTLLLEIEDRHLARYGSSAAGFVDGILTRWPEYRLLTWVDGEWTPAPGLLDGVRNYLFATDAGLGR